MAIELVEALNAVWDATLEALFAVVAEDVTATDVSVETSALVVDDTLVGESPLPEASVPGTELSGPSVTLVAGDELLPSWELADVADGRALNVDMPLPVVFAPLALPVGLPDTLELPVPMPSTSNPCLPELQALPSNTSAEPKR